MAELLKSISIRKNALIKMNIGVSFKISLAKFETQSVLLGKYLLVKGTSYIQFNSFLSIVSS